MKKTIFLFFFFGILTAWSVFSQNKYGIQPKPLRLDAAEGQFVLSQHLIIAVAGTDAQIRQLAEGFAQQVGKVAGRDTKVFAGNFRVKDGINFVISKDPKLGTEGYFLEVTPKRIVITAEQYGGFSRGLRSLMQLMPAEIFGNSRAQGVYWKIPCCYIEDRPNP
ncbi:MAG: glycoside hydrolase family 20 zincin-like fold domain-containing protein [Spirosomataceae bacterium]